MLVRRLASLIRKWQLDVFKPVAATLCPITDVQERDSLPNGGLIECHSSTCFLESYT